MAPETSTQRPTPIIVAGKTETIGKGVIDRLKPEYEVVHFVIGPEAAISEVPVILNGQIPPNPSSTLGSGNLSERPVAFALGGAFAETFDQVHDEVEKEFGASGSGLAWLRHDWSTPAPPLGPEYADAIVQRIKDRLAQLKADGKLGGQTDVYLF
ncbi:uncharacterized protein DNG_05957 [Cephalotrichum gorgonifer]|uniref:Uncharacterized protein n=1 Tax=Cephalotrichum gorgonifer TaxID=2041049 RepID=A0AAE8MZ35_9PEZI|nr:uncharacterized protein DNG_05957 [Cephalotrichum gorgonifer]